MQSRFTQLHVQGTSANESFICMDLLFLLLFSLKSNNRLLRLSQHLLGHYSKGSKLSTKLMHMEYLQKKKRQGVLLQVYQAVLSRFASFCDVVKTLTRGPHGQAVNHTKFLSRNQLKIQLLKELDQNNPCFNLEKDE